MIGIIGAMRVETDGITALLTDKTERTIGATTFASGKIGGQDVTVACCGVGKVFAAICAQTMILAYAPDVIMNVGVAGALDPDLNICDLVIADRVCQHDMDTSPLGDPKGLISGVNQIYFSCDDTLCRRITQAANSLGICAVTGTVASGDQFLALPADKARVRSEFSASVCEMEGGAIAQTCFVNQVPFCVLRSVSDGANADGAMDFAQFCDRAAEQSTRLIKYFLSH